MDLNLRGMDDDLVRRAKQAAVVAGVTLRLWVGDAIAARLSGVVGESIRTIASEVDDFPSKEVAKVKREARRAQLRQDVAAALPVIKKAPKVEPTSEKRCRRCNTLVLPDPKAPQYWRCPECKRQLDQSEVTR